MVLVRLHICSFLQSEHELVVIPAFGLLCSFKILQVQVLSVALVLKFITCESDRFITNLNQNLPFVIQRNLMQSPSHKSLKSVSNAGSTTTSWVDPGFYYYYYFYLVFINFFVGCTLILN